MSLYYLYILCALYRKIHQKLDKILTQMSNGRRHMPEKPTFLPISSVADVENFETVNDEEYMKLVCKTKFHYICITLVNLMQIHENKNINAIFI